MYEVESFAESLIAENSVSMNTVEGYKQDIISFIRFLEQENIDLELVKKADVENYLASRSDLSTRSLARHLSSIRSFFTFLVTDGMITVNPVQEIKAPKIPKLLPKALSGDTIDRLLEEAGSVDTDMGVRNLLMLYLLYGTGIRISELVTLKLQSICKLHVDKSTLGLIIDGKGGKQRMAFLHEECVDILLKYLSIRKKFCNNQKSEWLFPSGKNDGAEAHISRQRCHQLIKEIAMAAGLDLTKISAHKIRHSFATHMLKNGANMRAVQELLGHSDISSTQIYTKVDDVMLQELIEKHHPLSDAAKAPDTEK